jgi:hypothetical protein
LFCVVYLNITCKHTRLYFKCTLKREVFWQFIYAIIADINISPVVNVSIQTWCEFKSRRGKNKHLTAQRSNSNTVWFNFQMYVIFSINLVSQATLRSSGKDILYGCQLLRCLYNILYFLWLHNEFFIIIYNILKFSVIDCCQIIILSIYVPSTHA